MKKVCRNCRRKFIPCPRVKKQEYCGRAKCRRAWKRKWQRRKRAEDAEYRENQAGAQKAWQARHPEYQREYRRSNPASAEENRLKQRERNHARRKSVNKSISPVPAKKAPCLPAIRAGKMKIESIPSGIEKMDSMRPANSDSIAISRGRYCITPVVPGEIEKMDSIIVEISPVSAFSRRNDVGGP